MKSTILLLAVAACSTDAKPRSTGAEPLPEGKRIRSLQDWDSNALDQHPGRHESMRSGEGPLGAWLVREDPDAFSHTQLVVQTNLDPTAGRIPMLLADEPVLRDGTLKIRCKPVAGKVKRVCGGIIRFLDADNFYVAFANALDNTVRLERVLAGKRTELARSTAKVRNDWHELIVSVYGDRLRVTWDGRQLIEHRDAAVAGTGRVGFATESDSETQFDDLYIDAFGAR